MCVVHHLYSVLVSIQFEVLVLLSEKVVSETNYVHFNRFLLFYLCSVITVN